MSGSDNVGANEPVLWATATKDWVIPAKPKPGRKPKADTNRQQAEGSSSSSTADNKKGQNRAAQRAFRERKQEQLAELQERLRKYEQGESEKHVALQATARRLKDDNDQLRQENARLQARVKELEDLDMTRSKRPPSPLVSMYSDNTPPSKRPRKLTGGPTGRRALEISSLLSPAPLTPPHTVSSGDMQPIFDTPHSPMMSMSTTLSADHVLDSFRPSMSLSHIPMEIVSCGYCADGNDCLCEQIARDNAAIPKATSAGMPDIEDWGEDWGAPPTQASVLDNLPPYQAPVPLRRIKRMKDSHMVIDKNESSSAHTAVPAMCTGNPKDCPACADDTFGQAFCTAVGQSIMAISSEPCANCPMSGSVTSGELTLTGCCGKPCEGCPSRHAARDAGSPTITAPTPRPAVRDPESIPCNEAWQQIKAHPNASFADLRLLADVVARRSKCTGPRVTITPASTPDRLGTTPAEGSFQPPEGNVIASNAETKRLHGRINCGRPPITAVPAEAVKDAIRLLEVMMPRK